jgi:hypothetical protein
MGILTKWAGSFDPASVPSCNLQTGVKIHISSVSNNQVSGYFRFAITVEGTPLQLDGSYAISRYSDKRKAKSFDS